MYTRQEASAIKKKFWTRLGQYMKPVPAAGGEPVNWINYKTGIKHLFFRADADRKQVSVSIELQHPDAEIRELYFAQLSSLKNILEEYTGEEWQWQKEYTKEDGRAISRISYIQEGLNVFMEADWPAIISFLKPRLIALDSFWEMVKEGFE
jgi:hypothetical protein